MLKPTLITRTLLTFILTAIPCTSSLALADTQEEMRQQTQEQIKDLQQQIGALETTVKALQEKIQTLTFLDLLDSGLVAHYPFNANANDESPNGHHGKVRGATLVVDRFGNRESAYSFNGKNSRIKLSASAIAGAELSLNIWLKTKDDKYGLVSGANQSFDNEYLIYYRNGLILYYHDKEVDTGIDVSDGSWHMLTIVTSISQTKIYVDGLRRKILDIGSNSPFKVEGLWIGGDQDRVNGRWQTAQQFEGIIDDIRIYNRPLSDFEIQSLYTLH